MDLTNAILTSVYPHEMGDASSASSMLMNNMSSQISGKLVRISPNAFIYMTTESDDDGEKPSCHLVLSTDTDHYVGGISTDYTKDESCDEVGSCGSDGDDDILLGDVTPMDSSDDTDDTEPDEIESTPAPVDQTDDSITMNPQPSDELAQAVTEPIVTTLAPAVDVVNDQNDMIKNGLGESESCDDKDDKDMNESAYIEYPHQVENLDEALQQISTALTNRYGGTIILHEGYTLTHVRKDGLVDKVQAVSGKYKIRTHKIKV